MPVMEQCPWLLTETFFDHIGRHHWAMRDGALSQGMLEEVLREHQKHQKDYSKAGVGRRTTGDQRSFLQDDIRSDHIFWIKNSDITWHLVDRLRILLQNQLRVSLKDFESHFTIYNPGGKYERHLDQFTKSTHSLNPIRLFSFVLYLNQNWKPSDGGELKIYDQDLNHLQTVAPILGRLIVFRSDTIPHEVSATLSPRYSLTGWMRK